MCLHVYTHTHLKFLEVKTVHIVLCPLSNSQVCLAMVVNLELNKLPGGEAQKECADCIKEQLSCGGNKLT